MYNDLLFIFTVLEKMLLIITLKIQSIELTRIYVKDDCKSVFKIDSPTVTIFAILLEKITRVQPVFPLVSLVAM